MCCTIGPAELENTILLAHSVEKDGRIVNVVGYQNVAKSHGRGPNAMVLPFPAEMPMTRENCIDLTGHADLFKRYAELVKPPRPRSLSKGGIAVAASRLEVFDSGSYTVVLASDAKDIPGALEQVPLNRRPQPHPELFHAYDLWYPGWPVALCCWEGSIEAEPLLWWYEPLPEYREQHFLPGLDGHDGSIPDPARKSVPVDHVIVVGSETTGSLGPTATHVRDSVPEILRPFLPDHVYGGVLRRQMKNGDWVLPKLGWTRHNASDLIGAPRHDPPGFGASTVARERMRRREQSSP